MNRVVESLLALSQQEELVDLPKDYLLSGSEDEGDNDGEREHQKLLEAISSLDGKNRRKLAERSEASLKVSEFNVSSEGKLNKRRYPCMKLVGFQGHSVHLTSQELFLMWLMTHTINTWESG